MNPASPATIALQQRYRDSLPKKFSEIGSRWASVQAAPGDMSALMALQDALHRLAGSAGAYGYSRIGDLARDADTVMIRNLGLWDRQIGPEVLLEELRGTLTELLDQLQSEF